MNTRMLSALSIAAVLGAFACTPALAQNAMPASSSSAMSHDSMHGDAMMKKDSMKHGMMKHDAMMKKDAMHHGAMKKHGDSMKMKKANDAPESSGG